jgi:hypothetical protein
MALLQSELERCKAELGYHLIGVGQPYIGGVTAIFEQVVGAYLSAGATTTSATTVTPSSPPVPASITLALGTGFASGARVVVDVDSRQETVTASVVSGTTLTALFTKIHSGTYPVTVEGGETLVRECLGRLWAVRETRAKSKGRGALKAYVGDMEFYDTGESAFVTTTREIDVLRDELAAILGVENLWARKRAAGSRLSVY